MAHTINTKAFNTFNAIVLERKITNHEVVQIYDWIEGADAPIYMRENSRFKDLELTILIKASNSTDSQAETNTDSLVNELKKCTIKFDDMSYYYDCHFEGKITKEKLNNGVYKIIAVLACYRTRGEQVTGTANKVTTKSITNTGSLPTPITLTITPTAAISTFIISGLSETPITLTGLVANSVYVINGADSTFTKDGASLISAYPNYEFPVLKTGSTTVGFSANTANISYSFYPKFN